MGDGRVSRHLELERKIPQYCLLRSTVFSAVSKAHKSTDTCRGGAHVTMYTRHVN